MPDDALNRLVAVVGGDVAPEVLSSSTDGRLVAAFGAVVAKIGLHGEAARTASIMRAVTQHLGENSALVMPRVLWVRDDVLAMERLSGASYRTLVTGAEALPAMSAAGRGIAALHAISPPELRRRRMADHLIDLIRPHLDQMAVALPMLGRRIVALAEHLTTELGECAQPTAIHRDLHLGQLFRAGTAVAVVDWDLAALGDAALDLGNLHAYLRTRHPAAATALWSAFVEGYAGALPAGVAGYEALMYLRMAAKVLRLHGANAQTTIESLLATAEACRD